LIKTNELAFELCPAVNTPIEVQDLRKIDKAEKIDLQEWIDTAVEVLPEISEEIQMIKGEMNPVEPNIILNHSHTQIQNNSLLFKSMIQPTISVQDSNDSPQVLFDNDTSGRNFLS
jgi:hypothetical protein